MWHKTTEGQSGQWIIAMNIKELFANRATLSLFEVVCIDGSMGTKYYGQNGTTEEAGAYLDGYYDGLITFNRGAIGIDEYMDQLIFLDWAAKQLDCDPIKHWASLFAAAKQRYETDAEAFYQLGLLSLAYEQEIKSEVEETRSS